MAAALQLCRWSLVNTSLRTRSLMKKALFTFLSFLFSYLSHAAECPSKTTLQINSSDYSGAFTVELRRGKRPGSHVVETRSMEGNGKAVFSRVCPGSYFFSFGTSDSNQVSVTRYFDVKYDGANYNNPTITVFYSRGTADGSQRVGSANKREL